MDELNILSPEITQLSLPVTNITQNLNNVLWAKPEVKTGVYVRN